MYYQHYNVNEKLFESNKLVLKSVEVDFDGLSRESYVIEIDELFSTIKSDIKKLHVKKLLFTNNNCLICETVEEKQEDYDIYNNNPKNNKIQDSIIYALVSEYQTKLNEHKLVRRNITYEFDYNVISNKHFENALNDLFVYYDKYKENTYQRINELERTEASISQVIENVNNIYEDCKNTKNSNLKLNAQKEEVAKAYQLICNSEYIKNLLEEEYSIYDLLLTEGIFFGAFAGPLATIIAEKMNVSDPIAIAAGIITGITVPLLSIAGLQIKNKTIEEKNINMLKIIKDNLKNYYNLVYDESTNTVVDSKTLKKVLN